MLFWIDLKLIGKPQFGALTVTFPNNRSRTIGDPETGVHARMKFNNFAVLRQTMRRGTVGFARKRIADAGLQKLVKLEFEDYRDTKGQFDNVCSIEMIEAVGEEHWPEYFSTIAKRLKQGGTASIQAITIAEQHFDAYKDGPDFIQRYIFPGGMLLTKSAIREQGGKFGLKLENTRFFAKSYAKTLKIWREKFLQEWSKNRSPWL